MDTAKGWWGMKRQPTGLRWAGGKGIHSVPQGPWVASMLPQTTECCYVEPYAGMLGVLLQRPPSKAEIANDADGLLVNWWEVVRDMPEDLIYALETTPHSRAEYDKAQACYKAGMADLDKLERARQWTILVSQSIGKSPNKAGWSIQYSHTRGPNRRGASAQIGKWREKITRLAERIKPVQLENRPAVEILDRLADVSHAVIYCDPPYPTAASEFYGNSTLDVNELAEVLLRQTGRVAISGYGGEWNMLGWERHECPGSSCGTPSNNPSEATRRVEVLWTNYEATQQERMF